MTGAGEDGRDWTVFASDLDCEDATARIDPRLTEAGRSRRLREEATATFLQATRESFDGESIVSLFSACARAFGFRYVAILDTSRHDPLEATRLTTFPVAVIKDYLRFLTSFDGDPIWVRSRTATRLFYWLRTETDSETGRDEAPFRKLALLDGVTIPITVPNAPRICVYLGATAPLDLDPRDEALLTLAAGVFVADVVDGNMLLVDDRLTVRERTILTAIARGKSAREIGESLDAAEATIVRHLLNIRGKLGAENTVHAVAIAVRDALIVP